MSRRTRIKFCGLTRPEDVNMSVELGVDALGFVFVPGSRRQIGVAEAAALIREVPPFVTVVALFADATEDEVRRVLSSMRVDLLQFHGRERNIDCAAFQRPFIKAVAMGDDGGLAQLKDYPDALALLLDGHGAGEMGGQGRSFDWSGLQTLPWSRLLLAGGLRPDNVCAAVRQLRPYAVDVSSGIERSAGIKDAARMAQFVKEVRRGDGEAGEG